MIKVTMHYGEGRRAYDISYVFDPDGYRFTWADLSHRKDGWMEWGEGCEHILPPDYVEWLPDL